MIQFWKLERTFGVLPHSYQMHLLSVSVRILINSLKVCKMLMDFLWNVSLKWKFLKNHASSNELFSIRSKFVEFPFDFLLSFQSSNFLKMSINILISSDAFIELNPFRMRPKFWQHSKCMRQHIFAAPFRWKAVSCIISHIIHVMRTVFWSDNFCIIELNAVTSLLLIYQCYEALQLRLCSVNIRVSANSVFSEHVHEYKLALTNS